MASATTISTASGLISLRNGNSMAKPEGPQTAMDWTNKLQQQLSMIAQYENVEDVSRSIVIDERILDAPRRRAADPAAAVLAQQIAEAMYPTHTGGVLSSVIKYEKDLVKLRKLVILQRKRTLADNIKRKELMSWAPRVIKQGAWNPITDPVSLGGAPSLPMPVDIAGAETLAPFFSHLALGGNALKTSTPHGEEEAVVIEEPTYHTPAIEFERGVAYSDGRMDLCKMVLGPNNIGALMESLRTNEFVTHFLLGNNIIGPHGAKCIADFCKEFPNRMDTWYLAGNCIDAASFRLLVDEWVQSTSVTNIWMKRNPLGPSAADDVFRLITQTCNLRTLDLDQTELGDAGVTELFTKLVQHDNPIALRHVYLNAIGIGTKGAPAIAKYLASPQCALDAVYLANNPLGNDGVAALATGVAANKSLSRLTLASVGVSDGGIIALCKALEEHPHLIALDVGQSYATEDLDSRYNWITDRAAFAIHNLVASSPQLAYLNLDRCAMSNTSMSTVLEAVATSPILQFYRATTIWPQTHHPAAVHASQTHAKLIGQANKTLLENVQRAYGRTTTYNEFMNIHRRWLMNDKTDVRKIDSVYRNRDAGLARRGLKKLEKWWDEDDETLKLVMGADGPVCTMRKTKPAVERAIGPACSMKK